MHDYWIILDIASIFFLVFLALRFFSRQKQYHNEEKELIRTKRELLEKRKGGN